MHERFADWLERTIGERLTEVEEIVGYHLEQAHRLRAELEPATESLAALSGRAAARLASAGRRAYARGDLRGAVALLTRASVLLPEGTTDRLDVLTDLAEALREAGEFTRAAEVADEVLEGAEAAGAVALAAHARVIRLRLQLQADPGVDLTRLRSEASEAVAVFEAAGDEQRLAKAWELLAWAPWFQCRAAETQEALERSIAHARRAGDGRTEAQGVNLSVGAMFFGPTPVTAAVHHCEEILGQPAAQRRTTASALRALAGLRAMGGKFDEARASAVLCRAILDDLGLRVTAASAAETYGIVEMLAGDAIAAEREFRAGYEELHEMGSSTAATLAALLAQALYAQGRYAEALQYSLLAEERAVAADLSTQVQWRAVRAKALAALDGDDEAELHARNAVALAREMDFVVVRADAERDLGEVLVVRNRADEAQDAFAHALRLYAAKQNVVSAERTEAVLAELVSKHA
jgi:tetratricopeptide (TPR) repeat protein